MATSNPSQLLLLADHIKLSLLERQRAITLNLDPNTHDGQISRSLGSLQSGIEALEKQVDASGDDDKREEAERLRSQFTALQTQFHGFSSATPAEALTSPNDASLAADFEAAQTTPARQVGQPKSKALNKSVRFRDNSRDASPDKSRAELFPSRYTDEPQESASAGQRNMDNEQIHQYHATVLREQDDQLDVLGASIGRQRELSMQIGNELDGQVLLLDDVEEGVDRHQGQLNRARTRLERFSRKARENWSMTVIVVLIIILVLLIVILK